MNRVKELKGERDKRVTGLENTTIEENTMSTTRRLSSSEEYNNEDEYADVYVESDDPELYNDIEDDDLLLNDEDFPSDSDVNILDEDFIHESNHHRYQSTSGTDIQHQYRVPQQRRNFQPTQFTTSTRAMSLTEPKYQSPIDIPSLPSSPDRLFDSSLTNTNFAAPQQQMAYSQPSVIQQSPRQEDNKSEYIPQLEDCLFFDHSTIESFIRFHRAQIREVTEFSKKETKLLASFSLGLSSRREEDHVSNSLRDELKTSSEFIGYLDNLDEVLEMKMAAIEAMRDKIRQVLGEEEI